MTEPTTTQPSTTAAAPVVPVANGNDFIKRELNGTTFLSLEHAAHMALAVAVPLLIAGAIATVMSLWWGVTDLPRVSADMPMLGAPAPMSMIIHEPLMAISMVASLIVLVPLLWLLDRRTRGEWAKRAGYTSRLAYKAPLYVAIAALGATLVGIKISLLTTIIASLAMIGVQDAPIGTMYANEFLPALVSAIVLGFAFWYVVMLAKGRDYGKTFSAVMAVIGAALAVAMLVTAVTTLHSKSTSEPSPYRYSPSYRD